jgi:hypothetical protein
MHREAEKGGLQQGSKKQMCRERHSQPGYLMAFWFLVSVFMEALTHFYPEVSEMSHCP